jgi:hypothetical protein
VATVATVARLAVRVNVVVLLVPPPAAATVMVELPGEVEPVVLMVRVEEQVGVQLAEEKDPVAPEGNPETLKETAWLVPDTKLVAIELATEDPATTVLLPELEREKLNNELVATVPDDVPPDSCWKRAWTSVLVKARLWTRTSSIKPLKFSPNWLAPIWIVPVVGERVLAMLELATATPLR